MKIFSILSFVLLFSTLHAQDVGVGQWRDHLPYKDSKWVAKSNEKIYCANSNAIFIYNPTDGSIDRLTKIEGLSDNTITVMKSNPYNDVVVIGYNTGNLDLVTGNSILNLSDIKRSSIIGDKTIYGISFSNQFAYLACGFGIIVLDTEKEEIKDTYMIGFENSDVQVNDITLSNDTIYAATEKGLYQASLSSSNLNSYTAWSINNKIPNNTGPFNKVHLFNDHLFVSMTQPGYRDDTLFIRNNNVWATFSQGFDWDINGLFSNNEALYICFTDHVKKYDTALLETLHLFAYNAGAPSPSSLVIDDNKTHMWIADQAHGLVYALNSWNNSTYLPSGPLYPEASKIISTAGVTLVAAGGVKGTGWTNTFTSQGIYTYIDGKWKTFNTATVPALDTVRDVVNVVINPKNPSQAFAASFMSGLIELKDNQYYTTYDHNNSTLLNSPGTKGAGWVGVYGMAFDKYQNLWVSNSYVASNPISVKTPDDQWYSMNYGTEMLNQNIGDIVITDQGQKWVVIPDKGILVFDEKKTLDDDTDDEFRMLNSGPVTGALPSLDIKSIAIDLEGEIWVGTASGPAVFYAPNSVLDNGEVQAQQILIEQDGNVQILLETEIVTAIAIDGANKKWLGTENSGAYLLTDDGRETIYHFTEENSPLLSNNVKSIAVDPVTGEVFFATDQGIVSFRGSATAGVFKVDEAYAFPNPVKPGYEGMIAIKGFARDSDVKIVDISGNIVYKTMSEGGQAVWDGKNLHGEKVATGVYIVLAIDQSGEEKVATKIMFIR